MQTKPAHITVMLAVPDGNVAVEFYQRAFGANLLWKLGDGADIVAGLEIQGATFFLAAESPEFGTRAPSAAGFTTVRVELFVDDPVAIHQKAVAAGAVERSAVREHEFETHGPKPFRRMLQGSVLDPYGHIWLVGKFLD
ncbi:MAG TPA: VOC family protein [Candidatus Koribacter sp.]|jgi:uncharacterized glyoxalase superfamily protein PhnB